MTVCDIMLLYFLKQAGPDISEGDAKMKQHNGIHVIWLQATLLVVTMLVLVFTGDGAFADTKAEVAPKLNARTKTLYVGNAGPVLLFQLEQINADPGSKGQLTWKSSNPAIAKVDNNGLVTPIKKGTANIILTRTLGGKVKKVSCRITVKNVVPGSVFFEKLPDIIEVGDKIQLAAVVLPENALDKGVQYQTSNKTIATVSASGVLTAKKQGRVTISCTTKFGSGKFKQQIHIAPSFKNTKYRLFAIGNANYIGDKKLNGCKTDLGLIKAAFANASYSGQKPEITAKLNLTGAGILSMLNSMAQGATEKDVTVFYYSGHGMTGGKYNGALCGTDWKMVTVNEVQKALDKVPGKVIVMLDCCLSGQFILSKGTEEEADQKAFMNAYIEALSTYYTEDSVTNKALTESKKKSKYKIMTACGPRQNSYLSLNKGETRSVFTEYLAEGLGIAVGEYSIALNADKNDDSIVTLGELFAYVDKQVKAYSKRNPASAQTTMVWPKNDSFAVLARN